MDRALRARTYGDLADLLADLPQDGRGLTRRADRRISPVARSAVLGVGLLLAVTAAVALVALLAMLVLAAAAAWIALVLLRLVYFSLRRRLASGPHRMRPTGLL